MRKIQYKEVSFISRIQYKRHKTRKMYFIEVDGIRNAYNICNILNISLEEYIEILQSAGARFSPSYGWVFYSEKSAMACITMLNIIA